MPEQIKDGTGKGYLAKVNPNQRLYTQTINQVLSAASNDNGDAYNVNTGLITLTNAVDTPVIYIKNNEDEDIHVDAIAVGLSPSVSGTSLEMVQFTVIRNPTLGNIVSSGVAVDINSNRNYSSTKTLTADTFKGATGNTMTDGNDHILVFANDGARSFIALEELIPKGSSFGIKIKPQTGNTSMIVYVAVILYLTDPNA